MGGGRVGEGRKEDEGRDVNGGREREGRREGEKDEGRKNNKES